MADKVTAKDVALKAGVSVATVSYVLNGRADQKISPETKKKVLQIANLLNYVPSYAAKSLATGRNNAIGISYALTDSLTRNAEISQFVNLLIERFNRLKYDVTFIPAKTQDSSCINRSIDAIVAIDLTHADFRMLADNYLVPVICVDMLVNDTLFYQIYEDVPFLVEKAMLELSNPEKAYFIYDSCENEGYDSFINTLPENIMPLRHRDLTESVMSGLSDSPCIVLGGFLAMSLAPIVSKNKLCVLISEAEKTLLPKDTKLIINNDIKKANITMNIVMNALKRNFDVTHDHKIR